MYHLLLHNMTTFICLIGYRCLLSWFISLSSILSFKSEDSFLVAAIMHHVLITLEISKQTCYLTSICMTMLKCCIIKSATKPSSSIRIPSCLLTCGWWLMLSKRVLQGWRKSLKLWLLTTKYRYCFIANFFLVRP